MCFYLATLVIPYGICLIIQRNSCHSITFHVFVGALQLVTQPIVYTSLTKNTGAQQHFVSSIMIITLSSLSFVHAQIIRAWVKCMRTWHTQTSLFKLFWRCPCFTAARHQRALWAASIGSIVLSLILLGLTILAYVQTNLQTQIVTVCTLTTPSSYATYMLPSSRLP
jgi:hypothetical protein